MKAGLLDYGTKPREEWVGCHPGQVHQVYLLSATITLTIAQLFDEAHHPPRSVMRGISRLLHDATTTKRIQRARMGQADERYRLYAV